MREFKDLKIAVAGTGYVGLSIATLLSQHHKVTAVDIIPEKVELINNKKSPIQDEYIEKYLAEKELDLTATLDAKEAYSDADFVVIAAPTNYDSKKNFFDTSAVEAVIKLVIEYNPEAIMVIKSTIPVGYTASVREKFHCDNILFSPEFLRESKALYDNLYPSRIIVGTDVDNARLVKAAHTFAELLQEGAIKENIDTLFMGFTEAEAVKLFANTQACGVRPHKESVKRKTSKKKFAKKCREVNLLLVKMRTCRLQEIIAKLNQILTGYYHYYGITDNIESITAFRYNIMRSLFYCLNRRSQKKSYNWVEFLNMLDNNYPLVSPRIYVNIYE